MLNRDPINLIIFVLVLSVISACSNSASEVSKEDGISNKSENPSYSISGTIVGHSGNGLMLQNNNGDDLLVASSEDKFIFTTALAPGNDYEISVLSHPVNPNQRCMVSNGSGTVGDSNIRNVEVDCVAAFTVGGTINGLTSDGLVLRINDNENLTLNANDNIFVFDTPLANESQFDVAINSQPDNPNLTCSLSDGSGRVSGGNISSISISCNPETYSISGAIFGLQETGLVIQFNENESLPVNVGDIDFNFELTISENPNDGQNYEVLIASNPNGQKCSVVNGSGLATDDVINIQIGCFTDITPSVEALSGRARISWNVENVMQYDIYQSIVANFDYKQYPNFPDANLYSLAISPYVVSPLNNGNLYYFVVVAKFSGGHSIASDPVEVLPNRSAIEQIGPVGSVDWGYDLFIDSNSNLYLTGISGGDFVDNSSKIGGQDIINMKFDSTGVEEWRKQSGSAGGDYGRSIVVDSAGNIFVGGQTGGEFGGAPPNDLYYYKILAKYSSVGELLWAKELGLGRVFAVNVDSNDNVVVTGSTCSVSKFDNDGQELWSDLINDVSTDCYALVVDNNDNIYVIGSTPLDLAGPGSNLGDWDFFLAKYNATGTQQNFVQLGTESTDYGYSIDIDNTGNVYITGMTGGVLGDNFTKDISQSDVFAIKLDNTFNKIWAFQYDAGPITEGRSIKVDSLGNSYIAGRTGGAFQGFQNAGPEFSEDIFIIKLDDAGSLVWAKQYGTESSDAAFSLEIDESQNLVFATGYSYGVLGINGSTSGDLVLITEPM